MNVPVIICIVGVVIIVVSLGVCLIHYTKHKKSSLGVCLSHYTKHKKSSSEEHLTKPTSELSIPSNTTPESSNNEIREITRNVEEHDISIEIDDNKVEESKAKRKSIIDTILNRNFVKGGRRGSNVQFMDDRSSSSVSTNEDWINEQKYEAAMKHPENLYEDEDEEVNSNDGFWNSDLEPIQSSSNNKQESYAIPSLGKMNGVIVKGSEQKGRNYKRQSIIIVEDDSTLGSSDEGSEIKPTRVKSWKNNPDLEKDLQELLKNIDEEAKLNEIEEGEEEEVEEEIEEEEIIVVEEEIRGEEIKGEEVKEGEEKKNKLK